MQAKWNGYLACSAADISVTLVGEPKRGAKLTPLLRLCILVARGRFESALRAVHSMAIRITPPCNFLILQCSFNPAATTILIANALG